MNRLVVPEWKGRDWRSYNNKPLVFPALSSNLNLIYSSSRLISANVGSLMQHISTKKMLIYALRILFSSVSSNGLSYRPSYELNKLKSPSVIRATDGLVVRCWTNELGQPAGTSSNLATQHEEFSAWNDTVSLLLFLVGKQTNTYRYLNWKKCRSLLTRYQWSSCLDLGNIEDTGQRW